MAEKREENGEEKRERALASLRRLDAPEALPAESAGPISDGNGSRASPPLISGLAYERR